MKTKPSLKSQLAARLLNGKAGPPSAPVRTRDSGDTPLSTSTDSPETAEKVGIRRHEPAIEAESWRPFPVECLPEPMASFVVNVASAIGCDEAFVASPLIAVVASAIGTTRRLRLKRGWTEPPIVWFAISANSGSMKTPAQEHALRPVKNRQDAEQRQHAKELKTAVAEAKKYKKHLALWEKKASDNSDPPEAPENPVRVRRTVDDTTIEALAPLMLQNPRGLLLAKDELASWFGSFDRYAGKGKASGDSAKWIECHGGRSIIVDRRTSTPPTLFIPMAAVSVCGGIQPNILKRVLTAEHCDSGLAARLLFCQPPQRAKRWTEADTDPDIEAALVRMLDGLYALQHEPGEDGEFRAVLIRMTPAAKEAWIQFYNEHAAEHAEMSGELAAAWSKLEGYAARLALVHHCALHADDDPHGKPAPLDIESMLAGIALSRWFGHEAKRLYGMLAETEEERELRELSELVRRKGGRITPRVLAQFERKYKPKGAAEAALQLLVDAELGCWESVHTATNRRRDFVLNADIVSTDSPETAVKEGIRRRRHSDDSEIQSPEEEEFELRRSSKNAGRSGCPSLPATASSASRPRREW